MTLINRTREWHGWMKAERHRRRWYRPKSRTAKAANGGIIAILSLVLFSIQLLQYLFRAPPRK